LDETALFTTPFLALCHKKQLLVMTSLLLRHFYDTFYDTKTKIMSL
jgi:hypothetical protein